MVGKSVLNGISPERCLGLAVAIVSLAIIMVSTRSSAVAFAGQVDSGDGRICFRNVARAVTAWIPKKKAQDFAASSVARWQAFLALIILML